MKDYVVTTHYQGCDQCCQQLMCPHLSSLALLNKIQGYFCVRLTFMCPCVCTLICVCVGGLVCVHGCVCVCVCVCVCTCEGT